MKITIMVLGLYIPLSSKAMEEPTDPTVQGTVESVVMKTYKLRKKPYHLSEEHQPVQIETKTYNLKNLLSHYKLIIDITGGADIGKVKDESYYRTTNDYAIKYDEKGNRLPANNELREYDEKGRLLSVITKDDFEGTKKRLYTYGKGTIKIKSLEFKDGKFLPVNGEGSQPNETWKIDSDNRVVSIAHECTNCMTINYEYNDKDLVSKQKYIRNGELDSYTDFEYFDFDKHGNWTHRLEKSSTATSKHERVMLKVREIDYR